MMVGLIDRRGARITWDSIRVGEGDWDGLPVPILLSFMPRTRYCDFSVTELLDDPLHVQMYRRFDYYGTIEREIETWFGNTTHSYLDKLGTDNVITEHRMLTDIDGVSIGGTMDLAQRDLSDMWDFKVISIRSYLFYTKFGFPEKFIKQANMYRWLYYLETGDVIESANLVPIIRDYRRTEDNKYKHEWDGLRIKSVPVKVLTMPVIETMVHGMVKRHVIAMRLDDKELPSLDDCDTWTDRMRCKEYCDLSSICPIHRAQAKFRRPNT